MELNQITFPVKNMAKATEFYLHLGFTQIVATVCAVILRDPAGNSIKLYRPDKSRFNSPCNVTLNDRR